MKKNKIWLSTPHMSGHEQKYIQEAFNTNWIAPTGCNIDYFEKALAQFIKHTHTTALQSGTAALHIALKLAGVTKNDIVLCQTHTHIASANPITYEGASPVFIDSEPDTWNMSPELLEKAIKYLIAKSKKPKAIIVVHLYGMPAKMKEIMAIAQKYDIPVIEDAAESLGSQINGQMTGTFGDYGILSFNGNKIITTSGGGALITKTAEEKQKAIFWATQAREEAPHYQHNEIGYNYRMSNILAGIGRGQMEVLPLRIKQRRANFDFYRKELKNLSLEMAPIEPEGFFSNRWLTTILTDSFHTREKIRLALAAENIEARPLWKPMHLQPVFKDATAYTNGVSEDLFHKGLCLPSGSNLSADDKNRIVSVLKKIVLEQ